MCVRQLPANQAAARANWVPGRSRRNRPGCRSPPDGRGCGCGTPLRPSADTCARSFTGSTVCGSRALRSSTASRFWPRYSFKLLMASVSVLAQERCAWRASGRPARLRSAPDIGNGDGLAVHRPSSSPRPWAELFSMRPSGPQTLSALVQAGAAPGSRRAQPAAGPPWCAPASPSSGRPAASIGGPGLRPRRHAVRVGNRRAVAAQGHGQQARVLWLGRGARRLRQHPHGQAAQIRQPGRSTVPARQRHRRRRHRRHARPPLRPGLQPQIVQHAPDVVVAQRRAKAGMAGRPAARRRHAPRASAARPPAGCRTGPDPARWASAAGLPRAAPSAPARGRTRSAPGTSRAAAAPGPRTAAANAGGSGPRLGQQHARMRPADARAQRDGRQRQGDAPATPTPRRQGQQHGRRHLRAGPGQPPPGMRADRQVRVIAPGKGPMGHRQRLAPCQAKPCPSSSASKASAPAASTAPRRAGLPPWESVSASRRHSHAAARANASAAPEASARCPAREPSRPGKPCTRDQPKATSPATPASVQAEAQASRAPAPPAPARAARDQASMAAGAAAAASAIATVLTTSRPGPAAPRRDAATPPASDRPDDAGTAGR